MLTMLRRIVLPTLALGAALLVSPGHARGMRHLALSRSEPMKDSTVAAPKEIKLWFTEKPALATSKISLTGPDGKTVALGKITMDVAAKSPLVAPITTTLAPGAYTVKWTTASSDGHAVSGTFGFTVKAAH